MSRVLVLLGALLLLAGALVGGVALLAFGQVPARSGTLSLAGLAAETRLTWHDGAVTIEASTERDLYAGLGYAHGVDRAWSAALWRQAALGQLASWSGPEAEGGDAHARLLGFGAQAQAAYEGLPPDRRALLDAYAQGFTRATAGGGAVRHDEFVALGVEPEPWQGWHALAVERLVAYLGTPPPWADSVFVSAGRADPAVARWVRQDSLFRARLGVYGLGDARAFVARDGGGGFTFVQHVPYGTDARALFYEATLRLGSLEAVVATVPGSLAMPAGVSRSIAWGVFLTSPLGLESYAGPAPPTVYSRLVDRQGRETLLQIPRSPEGLLIAATVSPEASAPAAPQASPLPDPLAGPDPLTGAPPPPDTLTPGPSGPAPIPADTLAAPPPPAYWRVTWSGFGAETDLDAWRTLRAGEVPGAFALFRGDGLVVERDGEVRVLGAPPVLARSAAYAFAGAGPGSRLAATALERVSATAGRLLAEQAYSAWAARTLPPLLAALGDRDRLDLRLRDPYAFLAGWDFRYTPEAVAPALLEAWIESHRALTGAPPDPADSLDARLLPYSLRIARAQLRDAYGPDPVAWRWELAQGGALSYPLLRGRRFADVEVGPGGHPTALLPGPGQSPGGEAPTPPGVWSAWTGSAAWGRLSVRRPDIGVDGLGTRGRSLDSRSAWHERGVPPPPDARTLRLLPL